MEYALKIASEYFYLKEVPVAAVIVKDEKIIASGYNNIESSNNATLHAEILAINEAHYIGDLQSKYLTGADIYITLEPCLMCAGALFLSRISNIYFGAYDYENGAFSKFEIEKKYNNPPNIYGGIMEEECSSLIKGFFKELRNGNK
jgi:tRNA(adenine34) deaminase